MSTASSQSIRSNKGWSIYEDPLYRVVAGFSLFLKGLFGALERGTYQWVDDHKLTEIVITDQHPLDTTLLEKRPAIVTLRGPAQWACVGLGQQENVSFITGKKTLLDLLPFTVTFACISREGVEAQRLGWFLFSMLPLFKALLHNSIPGLHNVDQHMTFGPEQSAGGLIQSANNDDWRMVTIGVPVTVQYQSSIEPQNQIWLEGVEARFRGLVEQLGQTCVAK